MYRLYVGVRGAITPRRQHITSLYYIPKIHVTSLYYIPSLMIIIIGLNTYQLRLGFIMS